MSNAGGTVEEKSDSDHNAVIQRRRRGIGMGKGCAGGCLGAVAGYVAGVIIYMIAFRNDGSGGFELLIGFGSVIGGPIGMLAGSIGGVILGSLLSDSHKPSDS